MHRPDASLFRQKVIILTTKLRKKIPELRKKGRKKIQKSGIVILVYELESLRPTLQVMVKNMEKELQLLKRELAMHDTLANRSQVNYDPLSEQQRSEIRDQVKAYMDGKSQDIDVCDRVHFFSV